MQQNRLSKSIALGLIAATLSLGAQAHNAWLLPNATMIDSKEAWVSLDAGISNQLFEFNHAPLRLDNLMITDPDGNTTKAEGAVLGKFRSTLDLRLPKDGTYRLAIVNNNVMGSYKLNGETKRFRGAQGSPGAQIPSGATDVQTTQVQTRLETFVSANKMSEGALKPSGSGLELVPITHPTDLRVGEPIKIRFQLDGKPAANLAFSVTPGTAKYRGSSGEQRLTTDAKGEASFTVPAANMYWLNASFPGGERGAPGQQQQAPAKRYTYAATFEVLPQ
ncbi:DUF4198 domain-containing protein [Massilia sp. G4R7]|uniref:DUF4198 domain-containing protein n=1 Tax=Massilia phyllostachyos TaxID=2898585 RepID=A0ABS8Q386_9BURK|nr:DUF4198 domain-containing protein [Massilia phyllostachyos]MCD2515988.1 DUF4198 domain-containing protein [Massilia phyllostachyos]